MNIHDLPSVAVRAAPDHAALVAALTKAASASVTGLLLVRIQRPGATQVVFPAEVLEAVRERLREAMRPSDQCLQLGGCEFALVLPELRNGNHAALAANRLVRAFEEPVLAAQEPLMLAPAVGVATTRGLGISGEGLIRQAESALGHAHDMGEAVGFADDAEKQAPFTYLEFQEAIAKNALQLYLQPIRDLRQGRTVAVESLARWHHPNGSMVAPSQFVPYAERTGLILPLTRWSLNASLRHLARALERGEGLTMAVNLSARVMHVSGLVEVVLGQMEIWGVPPQRLVMEVSEGALMEDASLSARVLKRLRDAGIGIAIDDFGTGYASFSYLRKFPATELKIDKSFVLAMATDPISKKLVRAMVDLAHHLDIVATAEGIEDRATLDALQDMGCDRAQGFHIGVPLPALDAAQVSPD